MSEINVDVILPNALNVNATSPTYDTQACVVLPQGPIGPIGPSGAIGPSGIPNTGELDLRYVNLTGNQTISGVKAFATGVSISGNLQVSETGIFNALDLNNVDMLTLSGVDVSITNGNIILTNRPTVNGTGVLLSGEASDVVLPDKILYTTGNQIISGNKIFISGATFSGQDINIVDANLNLMGVGDMTFSGTNINFVNSPVYISGTNLRVDGNILAYNIVYITGNQNLSGTKNFYTRPTVNGTGVLLIGEAAGGGGEGIVYTTGNQTISGVKSFASRPTVNGTGVLLSGDIPYVQTNSYFYVDATRTDSYIENGNILYPYKTLSGAYNAAKNIAYFHNPTYITLLSPIAENLTIDKGYINLVGNNTNKNDPIRITGSLVFAATGIGSTITDNNFSIAGLGITATSNNKCILFSGNNPQRLFIQDCWLIAKDNGTCLYSNNTNTTSRLQGDILKLSPEGVNTTAIDIVSGTSSISFAETSSSASVLAYVRNNSTLNISNSQIETAGEKAFQVENAARLTLLNSVLTNTANPSTGIFLKNAFSTAVVVGSAISVPANANSYAINGVAYSYLFYKNLYFSIDATGGSTESKIGNNVNKNLINSYDPVVYSIGNQTISGVKTFANNLEVQETGIFNALDLSNISSFDFSGTNINLINGNVNISGGTAYISGNQVLTGIDLKNYYPDLLNFSNNFYITGTQNNKMILANSSTTISGIIVSGNATGFNTSIIQIGAGQIQITGSGIGIQINSYNNQYRTAGQFATISILHTGNNRYIMYGNTAL